MGWVIAIILIVLGYNALEAFVLVLIKSPAVMIQLACAVLLCIITCLRVRKRAIKTRRLGTSLTKYQEEQIKRAKEEDAANFMINSQKKKEAYAVLGEKIEEHEANIREWKAQAQINVNNMAKLDILGRDEWNTEAVDFLIRALESHRANNISEALRLYDEDNRRRQDAMHRQAQQWLLEFDAKKRHEEQLEHNRRMEELERERLKETKKIKESLKETEKYIDRLKGY